MLVSVVIPAYNESKTIKHTVQSICHFFSCKPTHSFEIIIVDDGSNDNTGNITKTLMQQHSNIIYLYNKTNRGKGFSVRRGIIQSRGDITLFMDADNSTRIEKLDHILSNNMTHDIIIGSRALQQSVIKKRQSRTKEQLGKIGNVLIRTLLRLPFKDTQCGFKIFSKKAKSIFKYQTINRFGFDIEILFIAKKLKFSTKEEPVNWTNNPDSSVTKIDYIKTIFNILQILFNNFTGRYKLKQ